MRSIIVEDESLALENLQRIIQEDCRQVKLIGAAQNIATARDLIRQQKPELVFLDIQLKNATAFDLLRELKDADELEFSIIFVTALSDSTNMARAFDFSALHYVTKPIDREKLRAAVDKATEKQEHRAQLRCQIEALLQNTSGRIKTLAVPMPMNKGIMEIVPLGDIIYLQTYYESSTTIHLKSKKHLTSARHLGFFKSILTPEQDFFPVSQSLLVNMDYVERYVHSDQKVYLRNDEKLKASRVGGQDFKQFLMNKHKHLFREKIGMLEQLLRKWIR